MMDDLESVAAFVRVVREGSFSAAARELGFSPSAVSKRIARLEGRLGIALLSRTTRKIALTDAGQEFFDTCALSLQGIQEAVELVSRFRTTPYGLLRVKVPQAFGRLHIAPSIPEFMACYPDIQLDISFGSHEQDFSDKRIDVLVASADPPNGNLAVRPLTPIERVTCAAPAYLERAGKPSKVSDLDHHNCLLFTGSHSVENEWVIYDDKGVQRQRVSGSFRTNDAEAIYMAVLAGVGIAHMPKFIIEPALASGTLIPLFRDRGGGTGASMKAYYLPAKYRLPKVKVFVDFLTEIIKTRRWES